MHTCEMFDRDPAIVDSARRHHFEIPSESRT